MTSIAMIGCGFISRAHLDAYRRLQAEGRSVAVRAAVDVREDLAATVARDYGIGQVATDYRIVLADPGVTAVDICVPSPQHREVAVAAAQAGKDIFLEKPIALTLEDADAIIDACAQSGSVLMVGQSHRYEAVNYELKQLVDSGGIGRPRYMSSTIMEGYFWPGGWRAWQINPALSGGNLIQNGIHEVDFYASLMSEAPNRVFARGSKLGSGQLDVFDYWHIVLSFASGFTALATYSYSMVPPDASVREVYLLGSEGEASFSASTNGAYWRTGGAAPAAPLPTQQFYRELGEFVDSLESGRPPAVTPAQARLALELALAAEHSARTGESVDLVGRRYE